MSNIVNRFLRTEERTLYALLIGIDDYPKVGHQLKGCKNDVQDMQAFLAEYAVGVNLQIRKLVDEAATRSHIIEAMLNLKVAKNGDSCLVFYSGHGSRGESPAFFHHIDIDGKLESIVCHDSRLPGGRDLTDKELSHLIWEITYDPVAKKDKGIHLAMVFDCCHAGGNTKEGVQSRGISDGEIPAELANFYGYQAFDRRVTATGIHYSPKRGSHIHLAAAKSTETAKEQVLDGKRRGVYTYLLLELLRSHQGELTYTELQNALYIRMQNEKAGQTPQAEFVLTQGDTSTFLQLRPLQRPPAFVVSYQQELKVWVVNMGQIHGLDPRQATEIRFYLPALALSISPEKVHLSHSSLVDIGVQDKNAVFLAYLQSLPQTVLSVGIEEGASYLSIFQAKASTSFSLVKDEPDLSHYLAFQSNQLSIRQRPGNILLYENKEAFTPAIAPDYIRILEKIAQWTRLQQLQHQNSYIKDHHFQLEIWRQEGADAYASEEAAPKEKLVLSPAGIDFNYLWEKHYRRQREAWLEPAMRVRFTNRSGRALYLAGLYLQADYKITDRFCPITEIPPDKSFDFQYRTKKGRLYTSIFLSIYDELQQQGVQHITEYLKLLISYKPFDISPWKQDGLFSRLTSTKADTPKTKGIGRPEEHIFGGEREWRVVDIKLHIRKNS